VRQAGGLHKWTDTNAMNRDGVAHQLACAPGRQGDGRTRFLPSRLEDNLLRIFVGIGWPV